MSAPPQGTRKLKAQRDALVTLLLGTVTMSYIGAEASVIAAFTVGVTGIAGGFMWGNANVHKSNSEKEP